MAMNCTRGNLLAFINDFYRERSSALNWQVAQAAMEAGLENIDLLREVFIESGGQVVAERRRGLVEWHWGRGGGSSTEQNAVEPPPDWMEDDPSATIAWMARSRNR
ncbi:MAG TPA: hypothetical protein VKC56_07250 [Gallionellaceae bacterium]|nr:hypothetical protein [Gallionellaceae bacterium]